MGRWVECVVVGLICLTFLTGSRADGINHCIAVQARTCSQCVQSGKDCGYCPDEKFDGQRCDLAVNLQASGCKSLVTFESSMSVEKNEAIRTSLKQSQVAPQFMSMTLLPGEEKEVDLQIFEPTKGPLDLYILMDFSNSMSDDLDNLKKMGDRLATVVEQISDDYTIGFGKFVDKVTEPQTDMRPLKLQKPWPNSDPPFSFQNAIALTSDINIFKEKLKKENISGNLDAPEGGFDAILQTAVCQSQIGWREFSTHILVFSTESAFHYEADGANVLAGILTRNDEQCHLDRENKYTHDTKQDYPSVPTLVRLLGKHNIIPIFAVTDHAYTYYEKLASYFPIAEIEKLEADSQNLLNILQTAFQSIRSKISIRAEDRPKAVEATVLSAAGASTQSGFFNITPGEIHNFRVKVKANQKVSGEPVCQLATSSRQGTMRVKPTTFSSALQIGTNVLCPTCDCEKTPSKNSARCTGNGDLVCGKCQCHDGWLGTFCNCSASAAINIGGCVGPNMTEPCSGRGDCLCGTCMCSSQYDGIFCQFDKFQCQRFGGFLCNDRGHCFMGACACEDGWQGSACECPISNQTCLDSKGGICNGRGVCKCGRCECQDSGLLLSPTCEANFQAQLGMCESRRSCVQCKAWKTGEKKGEQCADCPFEITMVDELKDKDRVIEYCELRDEDDDCTYFFTVDYPPNPKDKEAEVQVLKEKKCPPGGFLWLIPLIMFLMLLLGLLLLCCWKYCACCKACLALLPCCGRGRRVGFKEDQYLFQRSMLSHDYVDTPMVRTGPPKSSDVVRWKVTDNVHRGPNHPLAQVQPSPKEIVPFPLTMCLNRLYSESLARGDSADSEALRHQVEDNLNTIYSRIPGAEQLEKTKFRTHRNAGTRPNYTIVDTVLSAPRASYPEIVKVTDQQVQVGNFSSLKVLPGFYTVASDREATGLVELQQNVESVDVRVPLFLKDEDDDQKQLRVEALGVPVGIAELGRRIVDITITKDQAKSVFTFLEPAYTFSRLDDVVEIPVKRDIIEEDLRTQVTYSSRDLTAKDKKDYVSVDGDLTYQPGEKQKPIRVKLLELSEKDSLLNSPQVKQFIMDLSNPRPAARLGKYPRTTITIADPADANIPMMGMGRFNHEQKVTESIQMKNLETPVVSAGRLSSPPSNIKATATGPKDIRLKWTPPPNAQGYKVKYWVYGDPEEEAPVMDVKTPQAELTNLYPYCDYETRVCAYNAQGEGPYSDIVQCQTLEDVPSEPGRLAFNVISPTVTQLSWAEPAEPNGVITAYEVVYTPIDENKKPTGNDKTVKIDNPKKRMLLIENLQPSQTYRYKVRAANKVGWGPYRDATINLATQPTRPMSIPIIPDIPIVDAGDEYDSFLMYSNEVLRSPTGSKRPSVSDEDQMMNGKWEKNFLYSGGGGSITRNMSSSSYNQASPRSPMTYEGSFGGATTEATTTYITGPGGSHTGGSITRNVSLSPYNQASPRSPMTYGGSLGGATMETTTTYITGPGGSHGGGSITRNMSSSPYNQAAAGFPMTYEGSLGGAMTETTTTYITGPGGSHGGGSITRNMSSSPYNQSVTRSPMTYEGPLGGATTETTTTYITGPGSSISRNQEHLMKGGLLTQDVMVRRRTENRGYYEGENLRDSIVMGDMPHGFMDSLKPRMTPGIPETPTRLVFSALGPTALKVSWQEPHCERDVLGYCVLYQMLNGGEPMRIDVTNPAQNSVVVQDLLPNQSYLFKVKAQSQSGWGPEREGVITIESAVDPKSPLSPMPGSPFTLSTPSAPGPLVFTALSPEALQLSWEKPRKPNGDILGYVITCEQLHGGGDVRTFKVSGDSAETSLTVKDLSENMPYKFKVQAQTTQGFGPEREGIITIESQDGGTMSQYNTQSTMTKREMFNLPTEVSSRSNVTHTVFNEPYFSEGMMMSTHSEIGGMITRQVMKEVVQQGMVSSTSTTKMLEKKTYK
ncbi:integrin beta-4 isoform X2 [Denticeps clupeoides]|uniref:integrin beta-4 isoform X2 n=1 Tax=Denticeps clupeoides TaxID=299321 RepID=UPI0010A57294|nr:integrin beta-4 isoform X2 [Denticeps clupeoides]